MEILFIELFVPPAQMNQHKIVPAKDFQVKFRGLELTLTADFSVGIGGDKWPAAESFCNFVVDPVWRDFFNELFHHKRVVELGSGNGN